MVAGIEDYSAAIVVPQMVKVSELHGGHPMQRNGKLLRYVGGFCVVYPYETASRKYAVRCWHTHVDTVQKYHKTISDMIRGFALPYFVDYKYCEDAILTAKGFQPAIVMDWVDAKPMKKYIAENLSRPAVLMSLANAFKVMTGDLHKRGISHGDLQHGNILVRHDGSLVLVDYDSLYFPGMDGVPDDIKGLHGYQHPARIRQHYRSAYSDYFSELVIYTSILTLAYHPDLWDRYNLANTETMLFTEKDIQSGGTSEIFRLIESDKDIRYLGHAVKDALGQQSLDRIVPLQEIVKGHPESIVETLSRQWKTHPYSDTCARSCELETISMQWQTYTLQIGPNQSISEVFKQLAEILS